MINVLTFHGFYDGSRTKEKNHDFLSTQMFESVVNRSLQDSVRIIQADDIYKPRNDASGTLLTFDDGLKSCYELIFPILSRYRITGLFFIIPSKIGKEGFMNASDIRELILEGNKIGSHSLNHCDLTCLSYRDAVSEIRDSKMHLEDTFGVPVDCFSFPYGKLNRNLIKICFDSGFKFVFTSMHGVNRNLSDKPIKRNNIYNTISEHELENILNQRLFFKCRVAGRSLIIKVLKKSCGDDRYRFFRDAILNARKS